MKFIRLLLTFLGLVAAFLCILCVVAFLPAVQTWVAQSALSRQPGFKGTLASISAGFGEADVEDLRLECAGAVLTVPTLKAKLPITTALWRRKLLVHSIVAKGWTLDLSHWAEPAAVRLAAGSVPESGAQTGSPARPGLAPAQEAERAFRGILSRLRLPMEGTLDGVALEGDVLVPTAPGKTPATVHVTVTGGGLSPGSDGTFALDAICDMADTGWTWSSISAHGTVSVRMESPRTVGSIGIKADVSAKNGSVLENLTLEAAVAGGGAAGETYSVEIGRGGRSLVAIKASVPGEARHLSGTWSIDLRDSDLGAFAPDRSLPNFSVSGTGQFDTDSSFARVHARGTLGGIAAHLGVLARPLDGLGTTSVDARFDATQSGHSVRFDSLRVSLGREKPAAVAQSLQPFDVDERTGELSLAGPLADWMEVSVPGFPMAWLSGLAEGYTFTGAEATGELVVRPSKGGFALRPKTPITASGVSVSGPAGVLGQGLDLSLSPTVELTRRHWGVQLAPLTIDSSGRRLMTLEADASGAPGNSRQVAIKGKWSADVGAVAALHAAPALAWIRGRTASGDFSASFGNSAEVEAKVLVTGRDASRKATASVKANFDPDGSFAFLAPVKITTGTESTEVSAEGTWDGAAPAAGGVVTLTGGVVSLEQLRLLGGPLAALGGVLGPSGARDRAPFWGSWTGRVSFAFDGLRTGDQEFSDVGGTLDIDHGSIHLEGGRGGIAHHYLTKVEGAIAFDAAADTPYRIKATTASAAEVDAVTLFPAPQSGQEALVEGRFSMAGAISGAGVNLGDLAARTEAEFRMTSTTGIIRLLKTSVAESIPEASTPVADTLDTVGSAVGAFFGHRGESLNSGKNPVSKNAEAVLSFINEVSEIGCDQVTVNAVRGSDGTVRLIGIEVTARDVHIKGTGSVGYVKGAPLFKEPLSADLQFGARGRAADLLSKAGLLSSRKDELGYSLLSEPVHLGGTLDHIDIGQWHQLLVEAATKKPEAAK